jgi:hypothetical protein
MDVHLDEERAEEAPEGQNQPSNRRNGRSQKTVTTDSGKVVLDIPRDRNGTFDPLRQCPRWWCRRPRAEPFGERSARPVWRPPRFFVV